VTSARVRSEWRQRVAAEYTSAVHTQQVTWWLMRLGAPPDLLDDGLRVVADELAHARLSAEVCAAAGAAPAPAIDPARLDLDQLEGGGEPLHRRLTRALVRIYCMGETVAVPLFAHLRAGCTAPAARACLDRVVRDEVRHRRFGWDGLDWILTQPWAGEARTQIAAELPAMLAALISTYGDGDDGYRDVTEAERGWGLAPASEYAAIVARTIERDLRPGFAERGVG
jgi:hypothetical protein